MTIKKLLQDHVKEVAAEKWLSDSCKPEFIVSFCDKSLVLTCIHNGSAFSEFIFPEEDMTYGTSDIEEMMEGLYNLTM